MADAKLQAIISVANKASAPLKAINSDLNRLRSPVRNLSRQIKALDRASGFKELRSGVSGLTREVTRLGLVATGAAAAGFFALNKMAQTGDEILKASINYGIATDELQEWRFVAERSGVSTATLNKSMQAFTKRLAEARNGTGELHGLLSKVNPEFLKQILAIEGNAEAYDFMIKAMAKLPDQQRQILLGDKAFSEAGRELVKITALGADEIDRLRQSAHDYGSVLSKDVLEQSAEFQDEMTNMGSIIKNVAFAVGAELLPEVKNLMVELREWFLLNKEVIKADVAEFAKKAAIGIREFSSWVKEILPGVLKFIEGIGGMKTVAIALGLVIAGPLLSAIVALGAAMLATPLGLFVTAIVGAVGMITGAWNPLATFFPDLWDGIVDYVGGSIARLVEMIKGVSGFIKGVFGSSSQIRPPAIPRVPQNNAASLFTRGASSSLLQDRPSLLRGSQSATQKNDVSGRIVLQVEGNAKVKSIKSENPSVPFDVDAGMMFGHG